MADSYEEQLKAAAAAAYTQSREIAEHNKTLSLLDKLYEISVQTLSPAELSAKVTAAIRADFDFERINIFTYDAAADTLTSIGFAESPEFKTARGESAYFDQMRVSQASTDPFWKPLVTETGMKYIENAAELWGSAIPPALLGKIVAEAHVRSIIAYPLFAGGKIIGACVFSLNRIYGDLTEFEKKSLHDIVTVVAVALDKSLLYEQLRLTNERQEGLLHFIGHEVKGFLTKDQAAFAALAESDFGTLPETAKKFVEVALAQTRDGVTSITNLLKASNQKKGTVSYQMAPFDFVEFTTEQVEKLRPLAERKGLSLKFLTNADACTLTGDREQLGDHVLRNLLENAINYTPAGTVSVTLSCEPHKAIFAVKDSGVGITDEDKARLFTEGGRGKDSLKINTHSTGYGLFIAKNIVTAHHGSIRAESEGPGKGSTFIIELPIS